MKSLLYREFAVSKKMLLICLAFSVLGLLSSVIFGGSIVAEYVLYSLVVGMIFGSLTNDEKSGWEKYSRALPHTAFQRVGARYIFCFLILTVTALFVLLSALLGSLKMMDYYSELFDEPITNVLRAVMDSVPIEVFTFSMFLVSFAVSLPLNCVLKGQFKALVTLPFVPSIILCFIIKEIYDVKEIYNATTGRYTRFNFAESISKPQFTAMIAASALLLFAASYFISVIIETKSGREKLKAVKAVAAVLTVVAVAFSGATVYALNKDGAFEKNSYRSEYEEKLEEAEAEREKLNAAAREEMMKYVEALCGETLVDKKIEDIRARLTEIGFGDRITEQESLYLGENPLSVAMVTSDLSATPEYPEMLNVVASVDATVIKAIDTAKKAEEIDAAFPDDLPEADAVAVMKSYDICPGYISENLDNGKPYRTYHFDIYFENFAGETEYEMALSIDVIDGVIHDTRAYAYER